MKTRRENSLKKLENIEVESSTKEEGNIGKIQKRTSRIDIPLTEKEKAEIFKKAREVGISASAMCRMIINNNLHRL